MFIYIQGFVVANQYEPC